jgi:hypothetical protein
MMESSLRQLTYPFPTQPAIHLCVMPPTKHVPRIQVDPLDLESKTDEEHIQLALDAVARNRFKANG